MEARVKDKEWLVKNTENRAILLTDTEKRDAYFLARQEKMKQLQMESEMKEMKSELSEIKNLLKELLDVKS